MSTRRDAAQPARPAPVTGEDDPGEVPTWHQLPGQLPEPVALRGVNVYAPADARPDPVVRGRLPWQRSVLFGTVFRVLLATLVAWSVWLVLSGRELGADAYVPVVLLVAAALGAYVRFRRLRASRLSVDGEGMTLEEGTRAGRVWRFPWAQVENVTLRTVWASPPLARGADEVTILTVEQAGQRCHLELGTGINPVALDALLRPYAPPGYRFDRKKGWYG